MQNHSGVVSILHLSLGTDWGQYGDRILLGRETNAISADPCSLTFRLIISGEDLTSASIQIELINRSKRGKP